MDPEVRYQMLRPAQVVARRQVCPIVYIPIGTLEWHGEHNPLGADTIQAEGLAIRAAQRGGGLVFPPLYFGENRLESLMEANAADRDAIAAKMGLDPDNFTAPRMPFSVTEQTQNYNRLLLHILAEADTLGFKLGVIVAGHYPLIDHATAAVVHFNRREWAARGKGMFAWACGDWLIVRPYGHPNAGDHAARWETSHLMALCPDQVDLSVLPPRGEKLVGVGGLPPQDVTAEFGRETLELAAEIVAKEAHHRLEHPELYRGHGCAFKEGLWKAPTA